MKQILIIVFTTAFFFSCKPQQVIVDKKIEALETVNNQEKALITSVLEGYNSKKIDFKTLQIKAAAKYEDENNTQRVTAEVRIEKDKQILIIVRFLGVPMAKALITPQRVQYYTKLNNGYFDGDYVALSKWLGTSLDFNKVQNLLIAKTLDTLDDQQYMAAIKENLYQIHAKKTDEANDNTFYLDHSYLVKKQSFIQHLKERNLTINYDYFDASFLPTNIDIEANHKDKKTTIAIEYKQKSFNEELNFQYNVPNGYEQIFIEE